MIMGSIEQRFVGMASSTLATARAVGQTASIAISTLVLNFVVGHHEIGPADYPIS